MIRKKKIVLTYGTFDLFHFGHLRLLARAKKLGDKLFVGVSTDEFNEKRGKKSIIPFENRISIIRALKVVDGAFAETSWDQKEKDIETYDANVLAMGSDWIGRFDYLPCKIVYLLRTRLISSTVIKKRIKKQ